MKRTKELALRHKTVKKQNGITLIALVITIIVMLILVAVTINMAVNGGLFDYAGKAVADMKNAIGLEQQYASGRIKIGDVWYDSIDAYIAKTPSADQSDTSVVVPETEDDIIIMASLDESAGTSRIKLDFYLKGYPMSDEEMINYYFPNHFCDYVDYNADPEKSIAVLEEEFIASLSDDEKLKWLENGKLNEAGKQAVIQANTNLFRTTMGLELTVPYEQSLRVLRFFTNYGYEGSEILLTGAYIDIGYNLFCQYLNVDSYYTEDALEQQILDFAGYKGEFDDFLKDNGMSDIETDAANDGCPYSLYLKILILEAFQPVVSVQDQDGNTLTAGIYQLGGYNVYYEIPGDGTYKFTATMADGKKGEKTVVVKDGIIAPNADEWVMAWTYTDAGWSNTITAGQTIPAGADVVAKIYKTGKKIIPQQGFGAAIASRYHSEGDAYVLVIEGQGDMGTEMWTTGANANFSDLQAWQMYSDIAANNGENTTGTFITPYITDVIFGEGITDVPSYAFYDCANLKNVQFASTVEKMGGATFFGCLSLETITLPANLKTIYGGNIFAGTPITSIIIPAGVTKLPNRMLADCTSLTSITILGEVTEVQPGAIGNINENAVIYVPSSNVETLVKAQVGDSYTVTVQQQQQ